MPDIIKISELDEALALADAAEFPYYQDNGGQNTTYKAPITQIGAKIVEGLTYQGINLPAGAGNKTVENSLNYLIDAVGGDPNGNISDSYDPTAAYVKGDLCIYENALYICTAPTTGTFDPSKWTATTIDNVIGSLSTLTTTDKSSIVGAVNEVNGKLAVETDTYNIATYGGYVKCLKYGNMITIMLVDFGTTQAPATGAAYTLANIASKYRPAVNLRVDGYANYSSYKYDGMQGYAVNSDGSIVTYNYGTPAITKGNFIVTFIKE